MLPHVQRTRLLIVGGVVLAAALVAGLVIAFATGSSDSASSGTTTAAAAPAAPGGTTGQTSPARPAGPVSVLAGVPQHGDTLGNEDAPATMYVYEDPQCPYCKEWALGTFPTVVRQYVKTGRLKLVYQGVEIIGPNSVPALRALYAAGNQNKLWNLAEELYTRQGEENSGWVTDDVLRSAATAVGANAAKVLADAKGAAITTRLKQAESAFEAAGAPGTPTFVVQRAVSAPVELQLGGLDPASFEAALNPALQ
jgi:protein-disulfide isomerase